MTATVSLGSDDMALGATVAELMAEVRELRAQVEDLRRPLMTRAEAAQFFGRSRSWIDQKRMAGDLEAVGGLITRASATTLLSRLQEVSR